ncbi:hypothetical protein [Nocardia farcinica]|uniref:hypothetical protein n=1 Tax=Nocardia farcinica TaxID=37329 RepID=UPI000DF9192D|nr:hypothetical protein [Nocardia farcinica]MBF6232434.1 hypothetical protein [Nocardia farcinica]MBF6443382.1 hypothetical protein [Nocardia farcinica]SUE30472.1 Uncharacterised protein [Nocardia farcinica]
MTDEPLYDPDRDVVEDLDLSDMDVMDAYLNHPTTEKLVDDLGRQFRRMPSADQQRELSEQLSQWEEKRSEVADALLRFEPDTPQRLGLQRLLDGLDGYIEAAKLRMLELDG